MSEWIIIGIVLLVSILVNRFMKRYSLLKNNPRIKILLSCMLIIVLLMPTGTTPAKWLIKAVLVIGYFGYESYNLYLSKRDNSAIDHD